MSDIPGDACILPDGTWITEYLFVIDGPGSVYASGQECAPYPPESPPLTIPINEPATVSTTIVVDIGTPPTTYCTTGVINELGGCEPVGTTFVPTQTLPETGNTTEVISFGAVFLLLGLLITWVAHRRIRPEDEL